MQSSKQFKNYSNKSARIAVFGGMAILLACILPIFFTPIDDINWSWFALFPILIFGFFIYVIAASFLKLFVSFEVQANGLLIKKPLFHRRFIPAEHIKKVLLMDEEASYKFFEQEVKSQYGYKDSVDLSGYFYKIKKESPYYKYLTVTPSGSSVGKGQAEQVQQVKIKAEIIRLEFNENDILYLSPKNIHEFYNAICEVLNEKKKN